MAGSKVGGGHNGGEMDGNMGGMTMSPPSPSPSDMDMGMGMSDMAAMHMTFFWGKDVQILFSGWPGTRGLGHYLLALLFVFAMAVLLESLSYASRRLSSPSTSPISAGLVQTAVHALRVGLGYVVMLAVMSFNVGVLVAAVAGHALGFLIFGSRAFKWGDGPESAQENRPDSGDGEMVNNSPDKC